MRRLLLITSLLFSILVSEAQSLDTLRAMTYNLLWYRQTTGFCTNSNNNPTTKDWHMRTIIDHTLPDIFVVNEMGGGNAALNSFRLLSNALNQNGRTNYAFANANSNSNLANMLYFNSNKLGLKSQSTIRNNLNGTSIIRLIDVYTLYHKEPNLSQHLDTTFIHVIAAHLKAGNTSSDAAERDAAAEAIMNYINLNNIDGNVLLLGDLNVYRSTEAAYQEFVNYSPATYRFFDPINVSGNWSSSPFALFQTQSTRTSGNGCFSGGGMDNRFDFVLASSEIMNNTNRLGYIANSYLALGQDGRRYNGSLISPTNNSAPSNVINALYNMSDHLPVLMDMQISGPNASNLTSKSAQFEFVYINPTKNNLRIDFKKKGSQVREIKLLDISGKVIQEWSHDQSSFFEADISTERRGVYFINIFLADGNQLVKKLIKI